MMSGNSNLINDADYSLAFGEDITVSDPYNAILYNVEHRGKVGICEQTPHSTLHDNGSFATTCALNPIGTVGESHHSIYLSGASPSVTLPDASTCEARIYYIKNIGPNPATVNATAPSSIEGLASYTLNPDDGIIVQAFSGNWYIIAKFP